MQYRKQNKHTKEINGRVSGTQNCPVGSLALCCTLQRDTESHRHSTSPRKLQALRTSESPLTGLSKGNFSWDGQEFREWHREWHIHPKGRLHDVEGGHELCVAEPAQRRAGAGWSSSKEENLPIQRITSRCLPLWGRLCVCT